MSECMVDALVSVAYNNAVRCRQEGRRRCSEAKWQNGCSQPDPCVLFSRSKVGLDEIHFVFRETEIIGSRSLALICLCLSRVIIRHVLRAC